MEWKPKHSTPMLHDISAEEMMQKKIPGVHYKECAVPGAENQDGHRIVRVIFIIDDMTTLRKSIAAGTASLEELAKKKQDIISMLVAFRVHEADEVPPPGSPSGLFETTRSMRRKKFENEAVQVIKEIAVEERRLKELPLLKIRRQIEEKIRMEEAEKRRDRALVEEALKEVRQTLAEEAEKLNEETLLGERLEEKERAVAEETRKEKEQAQVGEVVNRELEQTQTKEFGRTDDEILAGETKTEKEQTLMDETRKEKEQTLVGGIGKENAALDEERQKLVKKTGNGGVEAQEATGEKEKEGGDEPDKLVETEGKGEKEQEEIGETGKGGLEVPAKMGKTEKGGGDETDKMGKTGKGKEKVLKIVEQPEREAGKCGFEQKLKGKMLQKTKQTLVKETGQIEEISGEEAGKSEQHTVTEESGERKERKKEEGIKYPMTKQ